MGISNRDAFFVFAIREVKKDEWGDIPEIPGKLSRKWIMKFKWNPGYAKLSGGIIQNSMQSLNNKGHFL